MKEVTDPALLEQLGASQPMAGEVTDPAILAQLEGQDVPENQPKIENPRREKFKPRHPVLEDRTVIPRMMIAPIKSIPQIPESGASLIGNIYEAIRHPINTVENVYKLGSGIVQLAIPGEQENEQTAKAVGQFFADRYGGMENIIKTIESDPVGFLADVSAITSGGGALMSKMPGKAGQIGQSTASFGSEVNPLAMAVKVAKPVAKAAGKGVSELVGGLGTHTGGESLRRAATAGYKGGDVADDFTGAMRGHTPMESVVTDAKMALSNMRKAKSEAYRTGMAGLAKDKTILDFKPVDQAIKQIKEIGMYKGKAIAKSTVKVTKEIQKTIDDWRKADPAVYHTPEGMDALKRAIGDIRDSTDFATPSRLAADKAYQAIKGQIVNQAPEYAKVMSGYEQGSKLVKELERTLSLGEKAASDTTLRKLQSVLRDNANTNYGRRGELANILTESGAPNLMEKLAGQALSSPTPRGLGKYVASGLGGAGLATANPAVIPAMLLQSPRLMGETAYLGGKAASKMSGASKQLEAILNRARMSTKGIALGAYQAGSLEDIK